MRLLVRWMGLSVESAYDKVKKVYKRIIIILLVNQGWRFARWWQYMARTLLVLISIRQYHHLCHGMSSFLSLLSIHRYHHFHHYYFYRHTQVAMCQMSNSNYWNWLRFVTRWDNNKNRNIWMIHIIFFSFLSDVRILCLYFSFLWYVDILICRYMYRVCLNLSHYLLVF